MIQTVQRRFNFSITSIALCSLCAGAATTLPARAEGSIDFAGAWGVNRVVRTRQGYTSVSGRMVLEYWLPTERSNGQQAVTQRVNRYANVPSCYFGGRGRFDLDNSLWAEVDAGLQFETQVWRTNFDRGWAAFISNDRHTAIHNARVGADTTRIDSAYVNPKVWIPIFDTQGNEIGGKWDIWRAGGRWDGAADRSGAPGWTGASGDITSDMEYGITGNGGAGLMLGAFNRGTNTFYWNRASRFERENLTATDAATHRVSPWLDETIFDTALNNQADMKRVVAMTRANRVGANGVSPAGATPADSQLDGAWLVCDFSAGQVTPHNGDPHVWGANANDVLHRDPADDRRGTGYDAPADNAANFAAWDARWPWHNPPVASDRRSTASRTIVEFLPPGSRNTNGNFNARARRGPENNAAAADGNRYASETVRINLRTGTRPIGATLRSAAQTP